MRFGPAYFGNFLALRSSRYIVTMVGDRYHCLLCEKEEEQCPCDKYCSLCLGDSDVRLCLDGVYYCHDCREACDYTAQSPKH